MSKESKLMDETIRNKIAESISLSKKPISSKRARELMINASGSKTQNAPVKAGPGGFFQWLHGGDTLATCIETTKGTLDTVASCIFGDSAPSKAASRAASRAPSKVAQEVDAAVPKAVTDLPKETSKSDINSQIMNLPDLSDKMPDMNDLKNFAGQLQEIDLEEKVKKGKKTMKKLGNGLNKVGNKMFGKSSKKEPEKKKSKKKFKAQIP